MKWFLCWFAAWLAGHAAIALWPTIRLLMAGSTKDRLREDCYRGMEALGYTFRQEVATSDDNPNEEGVVIFARDRATFDYVFHVEARVRKQTEQVH